MSGKPIDEAVAMLEALQERWCASTAGRPSARRIATFDAARAAQGEDDFDNEVSATRRCASDLALAIERIRTLTAAQQQGQADTSTNEAWIARAEAKLAQACDMGEMCIDCQPRNADGSCPDARANLAERDAEVEALRAEVDAAIQTAWQQSQFREQAQARAERLAEALRDARRALAFAAQHLPECNEPYERSNAALQAQEDRNG